MIPSIKHIRGLLIGSSREHRVDVPRSSFAERSSVFTDTRPPSSSGISPAVGRRRKQPAALNKKRCRAVFEQQPCVAVLFHFCHKNPHCSSEKNCCLEISVRNVQRSNGFCTAAKAAVADMSSTIQSTKCPDND